MTKRTSGWLLGCGIGCGVLLLGVILLGVSGAFWIRGMMKGFDQAVETRAEMEKRFGEPGEFTPEPDGSIPAARMEAFLKVRDELAPSRRQVAAILGDMPLSKEAAEELDRKPFLDKMTAVLGITRSALGLAGTIGSFFQTRNEALLEAGMGFGEYTYIYAIAYYAYLDHTPYEGPAGPRPPGGRDDGDDIQFMGRRQRSRIRGNLLQMLENQMASLPPDSAAPQRAALAAEIEAMRSDADRFPWQEGVPDPIRASLEPWQDRLEDNWDPATNGFELGINRKRGKYTYTSE